MQPRGLCTTVQTVEHRVLPWARTVERVRLELQRSTVIVKTEETRPPVLAMLVSASRRGIRRTITIAMRIPMAISEFCRVVHSGNNVTDMYIATTIAITTAWRIRSHATTVQSNPFNSLHLRINRSLQLRTITTIITRLMLVHLTTIITR